MKATRKLRWLIALLALVTILAAACGDDEGGEEEDTGDDTGAQTEEFEAGSTMAAIQEKGEVVIGVKFDVPPFGFNNPQSGEVEGFDVEVGKIIADKLGVEPKFVEAISDNRIPFLQDGRVDLILSTMTITTDREHEIDFSNPYFIAHGRILVPGDSDIAGIDRSCRKEGLHGGGFHLRICHRRASARGEARAGRQLFGVPRVDPERRRRCSFDRRRDPDGHAHHRRFAKARR